MTLKLRPGVNWYQMLLALPLFTRPVVSVKQEFGPEVGGVGSAMPPVSVVAPELSTVSEKELLEFSVMIVPGNLSFTGGGAVTVNVWLWDGPPPGGGLTTVTVLIPPNTSRLLEITAASCVDEPPGFVVTPLGESFQKTCALDAKLFPLSVI